MIDLTGGQPADHSPAGWTLEKYVLELQKVSDAVRQMDLPDVAEGSSAAAARELTQLVNEEDGLSQELGSIRRRLGKLDQLSSSVGDYNRTLVYQEDRLEGLGWFADRLGGTHQGPVCAAVHEEENPLLAELKSLADELKTLSASVQQAPPKLDEEIASLREELREREVLLNKVRQKRKSVEASSNAQAAQRQRIRQIYLFVGRVEQALENLSASRNVEDVRGRVSALERTIADRRRELDPRTQRTKLEAAVESVSRRIAEYADGLHLEHARENVRLNIRELALQFSPSSGRTDYLWRLEVGRIGLATTSLRCSLSMNISRHCPRIPCRAF